jgi:hypothetical protein
LERCSKTPISKIETEIFQLGFYSLSLLHFSYSILSAGLL